MLILCFGCNTAKCSRLCTLTGSIWFILAHKAEEMSLPVPLLRQEAPAWTHVKCHTERSQHNKTHYSGALGTHAGRKPQAHGSARQGWSASASKEADAQNPRVPCEFCGHAMQAGWWVYRFYCNDLGVGRLVGFLGLLGLQQVCFSYAALSITAYSAVAMGVSCLVL